jgi:hypothetical protein
MAQHKISSNVLLWQPTGTRVVGQRAQRLDTCVGSSSEKAVGNADLPTMNLKATDYAASIGDKVKTPHYLGNRY